MLLSPVVIVIIVFARRACAFGSVQDLWAVSKHVVGVAETIGDLKEAWKDEQKQMANHFSGTKKTVNNRINKFVGVVDGHAIESVFAKALLDIAGTKKICLEGLKTKARRVGTLTLKHGSLTNLQNVKLESVIKKDLGDKLRFVSTFKFSDLKLEYYWEFETDKWIGRDRDGTVELIQPGPNIVTVTGTAPKDLSALQERVKSNECIMTVEQKVEVTVEPKITIKYIHYDSYLKAVRGTGHTEDIVKGMLEDMEGEVKVHVKKAMKVLLAPATTNEEIFCENDFIKTDTIVCNQVNFIGEYDKT